MPCEVAFVFSDMLQNGVLLLNEAWKPLPECLADDLWPCAPPRPVQLQLPTHLQLPTLSPVALREHGRECGLHTAPRTSRHSGVAREWGAKCRRQRVGQQGKSQLCWPTPPVTPWPWRSLKTEAILCPLTDRDNPQSLFPLSYTITLE